MVGTPLADGGVPATGSTGVLGAGCVVGVVGAAGLFGEAGEAGEVGAVGLAEEAALGELGELAELAELAEFTEPDGEVGATGLLTEPVLLAVKFPVLGAAAVPEVASGVAADVGPPPPPQATKPCPNSAAVPSIRWRREGCGIAD